MGLIRFILGKIILFLDWLTSPKPLNMTKEKIDSISKEEIIKIIESLFKI